jgi:hypothetical protein
MHAAGATQWDGRSDAYAQFLPHEAESKPTLDWGVFDDPYQFYSSVPEVKDRLSFGSRLKWSVAASVVNRRVQALRAGA